jgi:hypothetical protein
MGLCFEETADALTQLADALTMFCVSEKLKETADALTQSVYLVLGLRFLFSLAGWSLGLYTGAPSGVNSATSWPIPLLKSRLLRPSQQKQKSNLEFGTYPH